ncbi:MAG: hypothetical protein ACOY58_04375, partial [Candidatus Micrarchaeota archaeon]
GARPAYYQGWWGKHNPFARYFWLCGAPPDFEATLYPETVEILVPACEHLSRYSNAYRSSAVTPDRQYLAVKKVSGYDWINLDTGMVVTKPLSVTLEECSDLDSDSLLSPDGRRIATEEGIYDAETGEKLFDSGIERCYNCMDEFMPCTWLPDNSGVVLIPPRTWGLELLILESYNEYISHTDFPVPQPILKLNVPEAYR